MNSIDYDGDASLIYGPGLPALDAARGRAQRIDRACKYLLAMPREESEKVVELYQARRLEEALARSNVSVPRHQRSDGIVRRRTFVDRAADLLAENPHGLHANEVAAAIGQSTSGTHVTLKYLQSKGRAVCHGRGHAAVWTIPGVLPAEARARGVDDAVHRVLAQNGPTPRKQLAASVAAMCARDKGRLLMLSGIQARITILSATGIIVISGTNDRGAIYSLPTTP